MGRIVRGDGPGRTTHLNAPVHRAGYQLADDRGLPHPRGDLVPRSVAAVLPPALAVVLAVLGDARSRGRAGRGRDPERLAKLDHCPGPLGDLRERGAGRLLDGFDRERHRSLVRACSRVPHATDRDRRHHTLTPFPSTAS